MPEVRTPGVLGPADEVVEPGHRQLLEAWDPRDVEIGSLTACASPASASRPPLGFPLRR